MKKIARRMNARNQTKISLKMKRAKIRKLIGQADEAKGPTHTIRYSNSPAGWARFAANFAALVKREILFLWDLSCPEAVIMIPIDPTKSQLVSGGGPTIRASYWNGKGKLAIQATALQVNACLGNPFLAIALKILEKHRAKQPVSFLGTSVLADGFFDFEKKGEHLVATRSQPTASRKPTKLSGRPISRRHVPQLQACA